MKFYRVLLAFTTVIVSIFQIEAAVPTAPQNLQPAWIYGGPAPYARLTWDLSDGANSYNVYRFSEAVSNWERIAASYTNNIYFDFSALVAPKYYVVTAVNDAGESDDSDLVTAQEGTAFPPMHYPPQTLSPDTTYGWVLPTSARII